MRRVRDAPGRPLALFGMPWAPFGSLWGALGLSLAVLGVLGDALGCLVASSILLKIGRHFPRKCAKFIVNSCKNEPPGIQIRIPRIPRKWWHEVLLGAPLPHAPGVRMT